MGTEIYAEFASLAACEVYRLRLRTDEVATNLASARVAYRCLDGSEERKHMAGNLPEALLADCLQQGWLRRHNCECALGL